MYNERRKNIIIAEQHIRNCAAKNKLRFSRHAIDKMRALCIRHEQVFECAIHGRFIERQYHGREIKLVFQEATSANPEYYVVIAASIPIPEVVTVCTKLEEVWEILNGIIKRKWERGGE